MTMDFAEPLTVDGQRYTINTFPLEPYRRALPSPLRFQGWPSCSNGYYATWEIRACGPDQMLYLVDLRAPVAEALALLFPNPVLPLAATWFSGFIRGCRGSRRSTGYPQRSFCDDEIILDVGYGKVLRVWVLDLRSVPEQTTEERCLSLPAFLRKA